MSTSGQPQRKERRACRRRNPRLGVKVACRKGSMGLGPDLAVSLHDLSESGLRLVLAMPLPPGQEVEVGLTGPGQGRPVVVLGEIVWCQPRDAASHWVGIKLRKRLSYAELQDLA